MADDTHVESRISKGETLSAATETRNPQVEFNLSVLGLTLNINF